MKTHSARMNRRALMRGCAAALAAPAWTAAAEATTGYDTAKLLQIVGEILIPATTTDGAGARDVTDFVALAVASGMRGAKPDLLDRLRNELDRLAAGAFLAAPLAVQKNAIEALDTATYAPGAPGGSAWPLTKTFILMGYYTSQTGGSSELAYDLVPGRFDPDIPVVKGQKALSNDWSGVAIHSAGPN